MQAPIVELPPAVGAVVRVELVRCDKAGRAGRGRFSERSPDELGMGGILV